MDKTVLAIQKQLKAYGYYDGELDGDAGKLTLEAVNKALADTGKTPVYPIGNYILSDKSLTNLQGVHDDLVRVVKRAIQITEVNFVVSEGLRTLARQRQLVAKGASKTLNSRHLTGHAVDLVAIDDNGQVSWDWALYHKIASAVKQAAKEEGVPIEWGGDWQTFRDGPHWQLPWSKYPK